MTWDQFKELLFDHYFLKNEKEQMYHNFLNLWHGENESVANYDVKFTSYGKQLVASEKNRVKIGLKPSLREHIIPVLLDTYIQCVEIAKTIEAEARDYRVRKDTNAGKRPLRVTQFTHGIRR
ncbi:hypothetical protein RJ639_014019 [Escallonia herrerae]|uniref:Retrotransposon gag domain-containing protein n=1 Tax=Escallonia herrerae TaxID=1293975 RepID=A0AA88VIS3_9ASTE|nr:hypothetical protein RJ639_014019 [Escallonia herrerae]